jgi:hypothetical protein
MYETRGTLKWIGEVQTFPSGFSKREFVVTTEHDKYPQDLKFEIVKDKTSMLDAFSTGSPVVVNFDIRGNEYNGKYFVNLSCWKLQAADGSAPAAGGPPARGGAVAGAAGPPVADLRNEDDFDDDEVPF